MRAFVLSGGSNRGAIQVGALEVLLEAGIKPDLLVGTSVGAVNAAALAVDPSLGGIQQAADAWRRVTGPDVYPGNRVTAAWRFLRGRDGLFSNHAWYNFLYAVIGPKTFGEIRACQLRIVATDLESGALVAFGDDPSLRLVDALMASTALPPLHGPWTIGGRRYIDGGAVADLPVRVAVDLGATEIFALNITGRMSPVETLRDVSGIAGQAVSALLHRVIALDIEHTRGRKGVWLHEMNLSVPFAIAPWDFSRSGELIDLGREAARVFLADAPMPRPTLRARLGQRVQGISTWAATTGPALTRFRWNGQPRGGGEIINS